MFGDLHDSAEAVVAALARVGVAVLQLVRITAITLRSASGSVARVDVAVGVDGRSLIAAIRVKVEVRLELELELVGALGKSSNDISLVNGSARSHSA